jgi:glyoxylase-like metal-dependent hydrolase (beta-lactamase superfamily II)
MKSYLNFSDHVALVDAGCGNAQDHLLAIIQSCAVDFNQAEYLLITHCHFDHRGGVKALKDKINFKIVAHELEASFLEQGNNKVTSAFWYWFKIQPFPVNLKISGAQTEIFL